MSSLDVDRFADVAAAYVHIPFCSAVCPYCDFAVVAGADDQAERYIEALCDEISRSDPWQPLGSVYFGGGTPSHISPELLGRVLATLSNHHGISSEAEISLEANPEDFSFELATALFSLGFNRVSFGGQSLDDLVLSFLGRRHRAGDVVSSLQTARDAGFENVSVDLIYGSPGESDDAWHGTLRGVIEAEPDHVSCYSLTVERGTPLGKAVAGGAPSPDPDTQADRYEVASAILGEAGFERYEVSNWAQPGHECRYNLTVWAQGEYEGFGNGAHRFRKQVRSRNVRRLDLYLERVVAGREPTAGSERIDGWDREIDRLFVGLRRTAGVVPGPGGTALLGSDDGRRLLEAGVIGVLAGRLVVKRPLLTDEVHRSVLALADAEPLGAARQGG